MHLWSALKLITKGGEGTVSKGAKMFMKFSPTVQLSEKPGQVSPLEFKRAFETGEEKKDHLVTSALTSIKSRHVGLPSDSLVTQNNNFLAKQGRKNQFILRQND